MNSSLSKRMAMFANRYFLATAFCAVVLGAVLLLLLLSDRNPALIKNTAADETATTVAGPKVPYASMLEELHRLTPEFDRSTVCITSVRGVDENSLRLLNGFVDAAGRGEAAEIVIASYTVEGDPVFTKVVHDGSHFYYVADYSRDRFAGNVRNGRGMFDFLIVIDEPVREANPGKTHFVVLTNNKDLTYELFMSGRDGRTLVAYQGSARVNEPEPLFRLHSQGR
jgi:hypothetical protein